MGLARAFAWALVELRYRGAVGLQGKTPGYECFSSLSCLRETFKDTSSSLDHLIFARPRDSLPLLWSTGDRQWELWTCTGRLSLPHGVTAAAVAWCLGAWTGAAGR